MTKEEESRVREALGAMDREDPSQWTSDGLPRVEAVAMLADLPSLTRADISRIAASIESDTEPVSIDERAVNAKKDLLASAEERVRGAQEQLATVEEELRQVQERARAARESLDHAIEERVEITGTTTNMDAIRAYMDSSFQRRLEEAKKREQFAAQYGLKPAELARLGRSPIDAGIHRRHQQQRQAVRGR